MGSRNRRAELCSATWFRCVLVLAFSFLVLFFCVGGQGQENRKLIKKVDPVYPDLARKMNMTGTVKVEITVAADGSVSEVKTLGGNPVLAAAVEDAVKQWKYASGPAETKKLEFKF
ncbi:MAG TPA: energy transducer TonB [Candidatus Methylomirabilis sp.]|nr:energy transducer TonB [Candidatus Methylomirabilis sp.]